MMHSPTVKQLKYLRAVAETKHFGNAAKNCHVSQSTLSAGIHELEETLGVTLIERNNKGVLFTTLGEDVLERCRNILNGVEDLMDLCNASCEPFSSKMRLGVIPTIAPFLLPSLLNKLRGIYPDFQLFIREDLSEHLVDALNNGDLDVLLLALPYPAGGTETQHLFYDNFLLAFPETHKIAQKKKLLTAHLKDHELLLLEDGHCLRDHALEACRLKSDEISIPYQATSLNTIVQMVANDIGITLLPEMSLNTKILSGTNVKTRAFDEEGIWRSIGLMWRKKTPREHEFNRLGELVCEMLDKERQAG